MSKVFFDIGANDGHHSIPWAKQNPEAKVYAFEPNPYFSEILKKENLPNYFIFSYAISDFNGRAAFNVCESADRGCSSLLELNKEGISERWGGRTDMIPSQQIEVNVMRLDTFMTWQGIKEIEFFHCDAQGSDLKVLQGMAEHITKIKQGVVEAATKIDVLYKGQNTTEETINYLRLHGFDVESTQRNDDQNNEINIYFKRL